MTTALQLRGQNGFLKVMGISLGNEVLCEFPRTNVVVLSLFLNPTAMFYFQRLQTQVMMTD